MAALERVRFSNGVSIFSDNSSSSSYQTQRLPYNVILSSPVRKTGTSDEGDFKLYPVQILIGFMPEVKVTRVTSRISYAKALLSRWNRI